MTHVTVQEKQGLEELFLCLGKQQRRHCPRVIAKEIKRKIIRFLLKARRVRKRA